MALLLAVALASPSFDWGFGGGWSGSDVGAGPAVRLRTGVDFDGLTPSLVAFVAPFDPGPASHGNNPQSGGFKGWGIGAELRVHWPNRTPLRVYASLGAGVGQVLQAQLAAGDGVTYQGPVAPYVEWSAGLEIDARFAWLGIGIATDYFNRIREFSDDLHCAEASQLYYCPLKRTLSSAMLMLTVGSK